MTERKLRLGAVGLGRAFSLMLPTFLRHPRIELVAGADPRDGARRRVRRRISAAKPYATIEELCDDPNVEAVYISTPHELHTAQACYAAGKRKHLLVEKPMALSLEDCATITMPPRAAGVLCSSSATAIHLMRRLRVRANLVASGEYGALRHDPRA